MTVSQFRGRLAEHLGRQAGIGATGRLDDVLGALLVPPEEALPVPPAAVRDAWALGGRHADESGRSGVYERAGYDLGQPWPVALASDAARVHRDGDRESWELAAFARQERLSRATVAAAVTLSDRWLDEVADGAWMLCEQSSWCWPAHDDAFERTGSVLTDVDEPFVDLGAGEAAAQLAWIDHLLGPQLDARYRGLRDRIRVEAKRRVLTPFVARRDWHWLGLDGDVHNWNPWIHGNVLVAALVLLDDHSPERAGVIGLAIEGLDRFVSQLPADGACDEGVAYWWEGACRALEALDLLRHATDGRLDALAAVPALRATVAFPHLMHLGGVWYVNVADAQARDPGDRPWHAVYRAARVVGDASAAAHAAAQRDESGRNTPETGGLGRMLRALTDDAWLAADDARSPLPRDVWLASTQMLVARERAGSPSGLAVAVKGGHNAEHHNHNDVGSFVVASDGVPVVVDAGRPTYTADTFGPDRYSIWTMQSSWHNVPEIRGAAQFAGRDAAAADVIVDVSDAMAEVALDLTAAYRVCGLRRWRRRVRLERPVGRSATVEIEDRWQLDPWPGGGEPPTTIRLLLAGDVELQTGGATVLPVDDAPSVRLRWDGARAALTVRPITDQMLTDVWGDRLTRLDLDVTGRDRCVVVVTAEPSGALQ